MLRAAALLLSVTVLIVLPACQPEQATEDAMDRSGEAFAPLSKYTTVTLTSDLSSLSDAEKEMIRLLIAAAREMDEIYWQQAYGDRDQLLESISDPAKRRFAEINYGAWDRLDGDKPFIEGAGPKPEGANFYPSDMSREEFEAAATSDPSLKGLYTLVRRNQSGDLFSVPYSNAYSAQHDRAAEKLRQAAALAPQPGLKNYLELRAAALLNDNYQPSDLAWMDMKDNNVDIVIGPIETYEDKLFGYKAAHEAYLLIKDRAWSERLARYAALLPALQNSLPVPQAYKQETPGTDSDLNAYDVVFAAGDGNAGSKTIAINLPNDEEVQLRKGTRRLQLKNAMLAKFEKILSPISSMLIAEDQRKHITFDAFFGNTMFHEVAHGLGIKNTLDGSGTVRQALKEQASALEEGKADILGLFMVTRLREMNEVTDGTLEDNYVTFLASIFRSIRFGATSAHGRANLARFNFFREQGAFERDPQSGTYRADFDKMAEAVNALSEKILRFQGDGDYQGVSEFMDRMARTGAELESDLQRLAEAGIPVDIIFDQGETVLGLQ